MKQTKQQDWKEKIHREVRDFAINKLETNYYRSMTDMAISKTAVAIFDELDKYIKPEAFERTSYAEIKKKWGEKANDIN